MFTQYSTPAKDANEHSRHHTYGTITYHLKREEMLFFVTYTRRNQLYVG